MVRENEDKEEKGLMLLISGSIVISDLDVFSHHDTLYQNIRNEKYIIFKNSLGITHQCII